MRTIHEVSKTSEELVGVEYEIKKALLKIYKEYTKVAGRESKVYIGLSVSTTDEGTVYISANNAYFEDGTFDSENPLKLWAEYEK